MSRSVYHVEETPSRRVTPVAERSDDEQFRDQMIHMMAEGLTDNESDEDERLPDSDKIMKKMDVILGKLYMIMRKLNINTDL